MDPITGMSYLFDQIQHKNLGQDSGNNFSVQGLNSPRVKVTRELMTSCDVEGTFVNPKPEFCNFGAK